MKFPSALACGFCVLLILGSLILGCRSLDPEPTAEKPTGPPWFVDVTGEVGLDFTHDPGPSPQRYFMPQSVGSGAALFDFDNDGRLDIYLIQNGGPDSKSTNRLFHQRADGKFEDVTNGSGLDISGYGMGVAVGDINNDGYPDVLVTEYGRVRLFLNNGNGTFTDITKESGLDNPHWGTSACFFDYDRDGWLDLVIVNYVVYDESRQCFDAAGKRDFCGPAPFPGTVARLFHNLGRTAGSKAVRFEDVTLKSGLARYPGPGLGVVCADFNGDRWPDIFIANDGKPNHLWINQHDGTFQEEALVRGIACNGMGQAQANLGIAIGDVDGDGLFDIFVTHMMHEQHVLWKQDSRGQFHDQTAAAGLATPHWRGTGFGTVFADFDQDGALDLALANGGVQRPAVLPPAAGASFWGPFEERNQLFANDGTGRFRDISLQNAPFCGSAAVSRGLACGDIDNDGSLDLLVTAIGAPARLYRNVAPRRGHWLLIRAVDPALGGRDAYGAEITVQAGRRRWWRLLQPAQSYLCSCDPRVHVGLGSAERVDAIEVLWPDGTAENYPGTTADHLVVLRKGEGRK
jgi:hypothetical protein